MNNQTLEDYFTVVGRLALYPSLGNLRFYLNTLFAHIDFSNKQVLEIGGGSGLLSFYAASKGARKVICLEPEGDGGLSNSHRNFENLKKELDSGSKVVLLKKVFQEYDADQRTFDIVVLHNSINHLDEKACEQLHRDQGARLVYREIFTRIKNMAAPGAQVLVADCSRFNIFPSLGLVNPFAPTIEWNKHQRPELWCDLLMEAGLINCKIRWTSFNSLRTPGKLLCGNKFAAFLLLSHFYIKAENKAV